MLITAIALAEKLRQERGHRLAAQRESVAALSKFRENYNSMPVGLFSANSFGRLTMYNPAFAAMFSIPTNPDPKQLAYIDEVISPGVFLKLSREDHPTVSGDIELSIRIRDVETRWLLARVTRKHDSLEGSIQDITGRKHAEQQLVHLVDHDHLTGSLNRRGTESAIMEALDRLHSGEKAALAYVELDRFRLINDLHGHATGDAILKQVASRVRLAVRERDQIGRLADSFVVVLRDCPKFAAGPLAERIRDLIANSPFDVDGKGLSITASIGVVALEPGTSIIDAITAADRACAEAKSRGRNCVVLLNEGDLALRQHLEELRVVADLQQRIPTERYFLEFQPIVELHAAAASLSYEVLIRMRGEGNEVIPPGRFIGAAERNGLMSQIDRWVLHNTLMWLDSNPAHRDALAFATVNISGASLNDTRFINDAFSMIAEHPQAMPKLCFEITEGVALHDLGSTRRFVDRIRMYGSKLALDDFGAGYTSFNYLKEIPADFIKIDGSFIKDINRDAANYSITRTIVDLTHELGMRSIAEWAETPDTIASLIELGVDYGQGFGLARPMAPTKVLAASSGVELIGDEQVLQLLREPSLPARTTSAARLVVQR